MQVKILATRPAPMLFRNCFSGTAWGQRPGQRPTEIVKRIEKPYWQERGWSRRGNCYTGTYQTGYGSYYGRIEHRGGEMIDFFICQPPDVLKQSSHWRCFRERSQGWYLVHMGTKPGDVSSGILA